MTDSSDVLMERLTLTLTVGRWGTRRYRNSQDELHRQHGPAVEWANGDKAWFLDGQLHRTTGPAIEWADGSKSWWLNGQRHRIDGPAIEYADGSKAWWLNGQQLSEEEFIMVTKCPSGNPVQQCDSH